MSLSGGLASGVVGLLASSVLKKKYHRPVGFARDDQVLNVLRSIPGLHIRDTLDAIATRNPGSDGVTGGHAMAAGLSIDAVALPQFQQALQDQVAETISDRELHAELITDGNLSADQDTMQNAHNLEMQAPGVSSFQSPVLRACCCKATAYSRG